MTLPYAGDKRHFQTPLPVAATGLLTLVAVVLVTFHSSLTLGFLGEAWNFVELASRLSFPQYMSESLNPAIQQGGYRPLRDMVFLLEFRSFGYKVAGYHWVMTLVHLANLIVVFSIIAELSNRRVALVTVIVYAGLAIYTDALFLLDDPQPEATLFYLLAVRFWLSFLCTERWRYYALALAAYLLALLGRETGLIVLPTLFLIDVLLVRRRLDFPSVARYVPFGLVAVGYAILAFAMQTTGRFVNDLGYTLGPQVPYNFGDYLALVLFPWVAQSPFFSFGLQTIPIAIAALALVGAFIAIPRSRPALLLLVIECTLLIVPYLLAPRELFTARYLYLPLVLTAWGLALAFDGLFRAAGRRLAAAVGLAALVSVIAVWNGLDVARASGVWAEGVRQRHAVFRDVAREHPTFPEGTFLYFIDAPFLRDLRGLLLMRYGNGIAIGSSSDVYVLNNVLYPTLAAAGVHEKVTGTSVPAGLRERANTLVYYLDATGKPVQVDVNPTNATSVEPALPASFSAPIQLEGLELTNTVLERGKSAVLLLYWRPTAHLETNYSVFVHLVDRQGEILAGYDHLLVNAQVPTSLWKPGIMVVDPVVLTVPEDGPAEDGLTIEVGLYELASMKRLSIKSPDGSSTEDHVSLTPLSLR